LPPSAAVDADLMLDRLTANLEHPEKAVETA